MRNKGITLISLVVTIVVLLILAGITIGTVFDDNRIIKKAQEAANATEDALRNEQEGLNSLLNQLDSITNDTGGSTPPVIGSINGEITWSTGSASLELTADVEGVTIQYKKNEESNWTEYSAVVPNLLHGDKVYVRGVKDGEMVISEKQFDILDTISPTVTIADSSSTTNNISITATATDNEAGMGSSPQYTFYIKKTSEEDSAYVQISSGSSTSVTKGELEQDTSYTVKVEVSDVAGNKGEATKEIITRKIADAGEGLTNGAIVASAPQWSNGTAGITLSTSSGLTIQYQINGASGSWTNGTSVTGLQHNDTVFARLTDGKNYGGEASITILDTIEPQITNLQVTSYDTSSITIKVEANDEQTGIAKYQFEYKLSTNPYYTSAGTIETSDNSYTYKYTGLTDGTTYEIRVIAFDKAGKQTISLVITQATQKANQAPSAPIVFLNSKTTNQITVTANSTDNDNDQLVYKLYTSTSSSSGFTENTTSASTSPGIQVTLQAVGLNQYTTYYYYVTATDGKETVQSAINSVRTYCPGTGLICNGPFTTTTTCSSCSGTGTSSSGYHVAKFRKTPTASYTEGRQCDACGSYAKGRTNAITCANCNSRFGIHLCTRCEERLISGQRLTLYYDGADCDEATCSVCNGTGRVTTATQCSHGKTSQHSYCEHGYTVQHD